MARKFVNKRKALVPKNGFRISRSTYEVWKDSYPNLNKEEWKKAFHPHDLLSYLFVAQTKLIENFDINANEPFPNICVVPLDDEYMGWLKENGLTNTQENRIKYINNHVDEENAFRLMKKHEWNVDYELMGIPLYVYTEEPVGENRETCYKLPQDMQIELQDYLEKAYGKGNVFVSKYIFKQDDYFENPDYVLRMAEAYFKEHVGVSYGILETQKYADKNVNLYILIVPFVVKRVYNSAVFNLDEICDKVTWVHPNLFFRKDLLADADIFDIEDLESTDLYKKINEYFGKKSTFCPYSICLEDIPEEYNMFVSSLRKKKKESFMKCAE